MTQWTDPRDRSPEDNEPTLAVPTAAGTPPVDFTRPSADAEPTQALPTAPGFASEPTQALPTAAEFGSEATQALPTTPLPPPAEVEAHRTAVLPTLDPPAAAQTAWLPPETVEDAPPPATGGTQEWQSPPDDVRGSHTWAWQMSRTQNRASTDIGLLLLRLFSLPLVLHGIRELLTFGDFVTQIRGNALGGYAPEVIAMGVIVAQTILPVLLALGFGTRIAAALQTIVMGGIYTFWVLEANPIVDPSTGALAGETALAYAALALPLVFTGPGRFSLDHGLTSERRERVVQRRVEKQQRRGNA